MLPLSLAVLVTDQKWGKSRLTLGHLTLCDFSCTMEPEHPRLLFLPLVLQFMKMEGVLGFIYLYVCIYMKEYENIL